MSEYLGSRQVNRSAYAVKTGTVTTAYLGVCAKCIRPVRRELVGNRGARTTIIQCMSCPAYIPAERLVATTTTLECDGSCMSAWGPACSCGCGGANHGKRWGIQLAHAEETEGALAKYRAHAATVEAKRAAKRAAEQAAKKELKDARTATPGQVEYAAKLRAGKQLSAEQAASADKILVRLAEPGGFVLASTLIDIMAALPWTPRNAAEPGVYRLNGSVYVVVRGKPLTDWDGNPQAARVYAKKLASGRGGRPELEYAPGIAQRLSAEGTRVDLPDGAERGRAASIAKALDGHVESL